MDTRPKEYYLKKRRERRNPLVRYNPGPNMRKMMKVTDLEKEDENGIRIVLRFPTTENAKF